MAILSKDGRQETNIWEAKMQGRNWKETLQETWNNNVRGKIARRSYKDDREQKRVAYF